MAVRAAADARQRLDSPPVRDLIWALPEAKDTSLEVEIIKGMSGLGEAYRPHVTLDFAEPWQGDGPLIRQAIFAAIRTMGRAPVEANRRPPGPRLRRTSRREVAPGLALPSLDQAGEILARLG